MHAYNRWRAGHCWTQSWKYRATTNVHLTPHHRVEEENKLQATNYLVWSRAGIEFVSPTDWVVALIIMSRYTMSSIGP